MRILGIESSCDDTGVAVVDAAQDGSCTIVSNIITGQDHTRTGGVVPEVAARHHANAIIPTVEQALHEAGCTIADIDAIAVTRGPGLIACLLVGVETAKGIAVAAGKPIIGVNHMEAHVASTFVEHPHIAFPAVVLLASGGHTMLVHMTDRNAYKRIGNTRDDAAGEAFDKVAKMLGLPYPGGPQIAQLAARGGNPYAYSFPRPMIGADNFDFSFAGLKTAVLYHLRDHPPASESDRADVAASFQESVVSVLVEKTRAAARKYVARTVILGGGVSANVELRGRLQSTLQKEGAQVVVPSPGLFTDNGAMIAVAAAPRALRGEFDEWAAIRVDSNLRIGSSITEKEM
jgi:N6-L-threonylcarbamoyladenine synthase